MRVPRTLYENSNAYWFGRYTAIVQDYLDRARASFRNGEDRAHKYWLKCARETAVDARREFAELVRKDG